MRLGAVASAIDPTKPEAATIIAYGTMLLALAALFHRERTGEGQLVQINMLDAITTIQMQELSVFTVAGKTMPVHRASTPVDACGKRRLGYRYCRRGATRWLIRRYD